MFSFLITLLSSPVIRNLLVKYVFNKVPKGLLLLIGGGYTVNKIIQGEFTQDDVVFLMAMYQGFNLGANDIWYYLIHAILMLIVLVGVYIGGKWCYLILKAIVDKKIEKIKEGK